MEQFSIRVPIVNFDGRQEGQFVQVDLMPTTNMKFQSWSRYAPKEVAGQKYIKGVIRNLVLEAASHAMQKMEVLKTGIVKKDGGFVEEPVVWEEYVFFTPEGLNKWHKERSLMKNQPKTLPDGIEGPVYNQGLDKSKTKRTLVSDDPDKIAKLMFGPKVKGKDLLTWDGCWKAAHESKWAKNPEQWQIFVDSMKKKLLDRINDGLEMPQEMLDELGIETPDPDGPGGGKPVAESVLMKEGGKRIPGAVRLNQRNAKSTMDSAKQKVLNFFGLSEDEVSFLGSTGKKLDSGSSGDIDIAISKKALEQKHGITDVSEWFDLADEFGRKYELEVKNFPRWEWQGTSVGYPISNDDGEQEGQVVQLDLIPVDNLKFQAWG